MATTRKTTTSEPVKMTPTQMRKKIAELETENENYKENTAWCFMCGKPKKKDRFYDNTDPLVVSHCSPICKDCAKKIALRVDINGEEHEPTKESIQLALRYLNKPFYNKLYDSSIQESENSATGKTKNNAWTSYIKNVSMPQYIGETYADSDMFKE